MPRRLRRFSLSVLVPFLVLCMAAAPALAKKKEKKEEGGEKSFKEIVAGAEKSEGFLTVYRSKEHVFVELPPQMFDRDLCLSAQIVGAVGDWRARGSGMGVDVVRFERLAERIGVVRKNIAFRADPGAPIRHAVEMTFPDSPIFSAAVESKNPQNDAALADLKPLFSASTFELLSKSSGFSADGDEATILSVHNNPENLTVRVVFHFSRSPDDADDSGGSARRGITRLPDPRNLQMTVQYDLFRLPQNSFRPRPTDDRLGVWGRVYKDYTDIENRSTPFRRHAVRWHVEKSDPAAAVSPAKEPITFYIDKATPAFARPLIREAVLWWNEAFESFGISDAVVVKDQPDDADWHPTDIRYSMIYWNLTDNLNFSGMAGPSLVNPLSGQVLKANAYLNAEFLSFARYRYLVYSWWRGPSVRSWAQEGRDAFDGPRADRSSWWSLAEERAEARDSRSYLCDYEASFSSQLAFARLVLQSRGLLPPGGAEEDRYAREAFHELVAHEIGHALGFAHNFKASRLSRYDDILSGAVGGAISGSIMDYNPINLPPRGHAPGPFFLTELGEYDRFAAEYLYRPFDQLSAEEEAAELSVLAARAETEPGLAFDDGTLSESDPTSNTDDLGDEPLRFADDRLAMVAEVLPQLPDLVLAEGHNYNSIRQALDAAIFSVSMDYLDMASRFIGGREILRIHHRPAAPGGGAGGPAPIRPIAAETQHAALDLIERRLFADGAFRVGAKFLNQLQADMEYDWNYPQHYAKDYDYEARLAWLYGTTLATILEPQRLMRVKDNETRYLDGEVRFTLPDLMGRLTDGIFKGLEKGNVSTSATISPMMASKRRTLQRIYVGLLSDLALSPEEGTPADASVLAVAELKRIGKRAERALGAQATSALLDGYGRAHLDDLTARVGRVLDAKIGLPVEAR